jgi:murein DD-endopeptidase MepM/ murein hydrolase activator NlpD
VYSATDGTVMSTRRGCKPGNSCVDFGNFVRVKSDGMDLVYAHLSTVDVKKGDVVTSGQRIGAVGMTGFTLGPHLHVEVIENSKSVDGCQRGLTCLACEDCTNCRKMKRMRNRR